MSRKTTVVGKELRQLLAQHEERLVTVWHVDDEAIDVVPMVGSCQISRSDAGVGACVPYPARHQRVVLGIDAVQQLGGEIADEAIGAVVGESLR